MTPRADGPADLLAALDGYLDHLRVERGLSAATIRAYDNDLRGFAARGAGIAGWATDPDVPRAYLAALTRPRGARGDGRPTGEGGPGRRG